MTFMKHFLCVMNFIYISQLVSKMFLWSINRYYSSHSGGKLRLKSKLIYSRSISCQVDSRIQAQGGLVLKPYLLPLYTSHTCCLWEQHDWPSAWMILSHMGDLLHIADVEIVHIEMVITDTKWIRQPRKGEGRVNGIREEEKSEKKIKK